MNKHQHADPQLNPLQWCLDVPAGPQKIPARGRSVPEIRELAGLAGQAKTAMEALLVGCAAGAADPGVAACRAPGCRGWGRAKSKVLRTVVRVSGECHTLWIAFRP